MKAHPSVSVERYQATIRTAIDPTGDTINFGVSDVGAQPATWEVGVWVGSWTYNRAVALSPTIGGTGTGADIELADGLYDLWFQIVDVDEQPAQRFDSIRVWT